MLPQVDCAPNFCEGRISIVDVEDDDNIVTVAFNKAWRFIENDPFLAHNSELVLRNRLRAHLEILIKVGEHNPPLPTR